MLADAISLQIVCTVFDISWNLSYTLGGGIWSQANFPPFFWQLKDLARWSKMVLLWFGRSNVIKMNFFPHLLYLFPALPIKIPGIFLNQFRSEFENFLWAGKAHHLLTTLD